MSRKLNFILLFLLLSGISAFAQTPKSRWAKFDGNKIHYYDVGSSKNKNAIVFVHGWTCTADFWSESYNAFPEYRVIALDLPGHGKSDKPTANYTMDYFAKAVEAVVKKAKVKKVVLVGHSMGTPIIRQFYRLYPDQTLALVIVDGMLRQFANKEQMAQFVALLRSDYKKNAPLMVDGMLMPVKDASLKKRIRETMLATPDYVALSAMDGMADEKIYAPDKINVPVLALMAQSAFWTPDVKDVYRSIAPDIDFQMWTDVSHFLMMEKPKEFNDELRKFIVRKKLL
jgi:pimeloyl-ACP methyl ester carboxylesterase